MQPIFDAPGVLIGSGDMPYGTEIRLAQLAESLGYSEFWYTDNKFVRDCFAGLALVAANTTTIKIGPGVSDPYSRHPAMIGMGLATLDEMSGGRVQGGLGTGGTDLPAMRIEKTRPVRALREAIEIIRLLVSGQQVNYTGELLHLDGSKLGFTPCRTEIPLFVATHAPLALNVAGQFADGVLLSHTASRADLETALAAVRAGQRKAGRAPDSVRIHIRLEACIADTDEAALQRMRPGVARRLISRYPNWDAEAGLIATDELREAAAGKDFDAVCAALPEAAVRGSSLVGSPDTILAQMSEVMGPGVDQITIRPIPVAGQSFDDSMTTFMNDVWRRFRTADAR